MAKSATARRAEAKLPQMVRFVDAMNALGVSERTMYRLLASGELPRSYKSRRLRLIPVSDIEAYLERNRCAA